VVAAVAAATALACRPHPGLGTLTLTRGGDRIVVDLATCRETISPAAPPRGTTGEIISPDGRAIARVVAVHRTGAPAGFASIVIRSRATGSTRAVYRVRESYTSVPAGTPGPLELVGWSRDGDWLLFYIDPMGSASLAADGLELRVVRVAGGKAHAVTGLLAYADYRAWCGNRLVLTAGGDRIATTNKRLVVTGSPSWTVRPIVHAPSRAWGSLACAPDGSYVVVQSQRASGEAYFFATHWALWRVGLDGRKRRLTSPPTGYADESPRFSYDGRTILFVRSRKGVGRLYALRDGKLTGPLLSLGYQLGYYGHQDWWATMSWSLAPD